MIAPTTQPQNSKRMPPQNAPSMLLSNEENKTLFKILGDKCQTQASAVVQVFGTDPPNHNLWNKRHCGVVTFTKDSNRKSYFIQVFDIEKEQKVFEQELYNQFSYHISLNFFHQFESDSQMTGLNFADEQEAEVFRKVVLDRLATKQRKREERRRKQQQELEQSSSTPTPQVAQNHSLNHQTSSQSTLSSSNQSLNKVKKGRSRKTNRIKKEEIGQPQNFQHITHVGFDQNKGFSTFHDENLLKFFKNAGVNEKLLQDEKARKFIYDFIEKNGGLERATRESKMYEAFSLRPPAAHERPHPAAAKPALPSRTAASTGTAAAPPPPPPRPHPAPPPPPPPKDRSIHDRPPAPAPPAPIRTYNVPGGPPTPPTPPPPPPAARPASIGTPAAAPPPPPPPPPPQAPSAPPPPPPAAGGGAPHAPPNSLQDPNARTELLAQIRQRPTLQPVAQKKQEKPPPQDSHSNLMSEIRAREYELKHVDVAESTSPAPTPLVENTMAALLAKALDERARVLGESDSDEDEDEEDDEWDDN